MAESTLTLKVTDLKAAVGLFLGYGQGSVGGYADATWTARQSAVLDTIVKSGLRQFYFPAPDQAGVSYEWSFLRPSAALDLPTGQMTIRLPDDFGGFDGRISLTTASNEVGIPIDICGMAKIRQLRSEFPTTTGRPLWAAVDPIKGVTANHGSRFNLEIYPIADENYTLSGAYHIHPDALTGTSPYAYGGVEHSETIQAAIIAAAELYLDDTAQVRKAYFAERLATSVSQDRKLKPQALGYNRDDSNRKYGSRRGPRESWFRGDVTVNGTLY